MPKKKKATKKKSGKTKPVHKLVTNQMPWPPIKEPKLDRHDLGLAETPVGKRIKKEKNRRGWDKALAQDRKAKRTKQSWKKAVTRSRAQSGGSSTQVTWDGDN